jgi:hypothetical protein
VIPDVVLVWNRVHPLAADYRGAWAAAVRDPQRNLVDVKDRVFVEWRTILRTHFVTVGKELR